MALLDLLKLSKRPKPELSLKLLIDKFYYQEQMDLAEKKKTDRDIKIEEARIELALAKRKLRTWKSREEHDRSKFYHPSSLGSCARQTFYKFCGAPENDTDSISLVDNGKTQRKFKNGDYFHWRMGMLLVRMGLCTIEEIEVPFQVKDMQGTGDAVFTHLGQKIVVDFKSANEYGFNQVNPDYPDEKYERQLRMYMMIFKADYGILLYESKNDHSIKEIILKRDIKKEKELVLQRLNYLRHHVNEKEAPEKEGDSITRIPCNSCQFSSLCWDELKDRKWRKRLKRRLAD